MDTQIKLIVSGVILAIFSLLGVTAWYYHSKYITTSNLLAVEQEKFKSATAAAEACTKGVSDLEKAAATKAAEAAAAKEKAEELAKKNERLAQHILEMQPSNPNNKTESAVDLYKKYKKGLAK